MFHAPAIHHGTYWCRSLRGKRGTSGETAAICLRYAATGTGRDVLPANRANAFDQQPYRADEQYCEHDVVGAESIADGGSRSDDCRDAQSVQRQWSIDAGVYLWGAVLHEVLRCVRS